MLRGVPIIDSYLCLTKLSEQTLLELIIYQEDCSQYIGKKWTSLHQVFDPYSIKTGLE